MQIVVVMFENECMRSCLDKHSLELIILPRQLTKSFDKIKSEREGPLTEEQLQHHSSSNTSPRATFATANERSTNPSTPIRVKLW